MSEKLISIIILNYNGEKFLKKCLESILDESHHDIEIIIVDNNSPDKSAEKILSDFKNCKFIINKKNLGVPEGLNIGINNSSGKYVVLMNNDITVTSKWLDRLLQAHKENGDGLYQPKLLEMKNPNNINSGGNMINVFGFGFSKSKGKKNTDKNEKIEEISYASGACLFTTKKVLEEIGPLDKKLFAYHEDLDLGWKARLLDYKSYFVPKSIVYHFGSAQWQWSSQKFFLLERNRWIILLSNYSLKTIIRLYPSLLIIELFLLIFFVKKKLLLTKIKSIGGTIKSYNHIRERRKYNKKLSRIKDQEIIKSFCWNIQIPDEVAESRNTKLFNNLLKLMTKMIGMHGNLKTS